MKQRAKLSLAAADGTDKRQASGFERTTTTSPEAKPSKAQTHYKAASPQNPGRASTRAEGITERRMWPSSRQVAGVLLAVAASAVALYLLKRRFS